MLQRHRPAGRTVPFLENNTDTEGPSTRIALWKCVRRDHGFLNRSAREIERLALRLHIQSARARLRADHAQELKLQDLPAADRWWKRQWRQADDSADVV